MATMVGISRAIATNDNKKLLIHKRHRHDPSGEIQERSLNPENIGENMGRTVCCNYIHTSHELDCGPDLQRKHANFRNHLGTYHVVNLDPNVNKV